MCSIGAVILVVTLVLLSTLQSAEEVREKWVTERVCSGDWQCVGVQVVGDD